MHRKKAVIRKNQKHFQIVSMPYALRLLYSISLEMSILAIHKKIQYRKIPFYSHPDCLAGSAPALQRIIVAKTTIGQRDKAGVS